jgi:hypothetical protein
LALFAPALPTEKAAVSARAVTATAVTHVRLFRDDPPDGSRRMIPLLEVDRAFHPH